MGSGRERDDPLTFVNNPSSSSSPITVSDHLDNFLGDSNPQPGSFQSEGLLGGAERSDTDYGFTRPDFGLNQLAGTVQFYERHVFLCYKNPSVWPARIEAAEFDRLPRLLSAVLSARRNDIKRQTRLTICEGHDGTETSDGDVLIFPDMIRYRRLTHFDVDTFVEDVLVKDGEWLPGTPETLKGSYIFVCSHGTRDRRCGVCGPVLVNRFREEIELHGLQGKVSVSPCSHIGGHRYAGNVILFGKNSHGEVTGHWYGYVSPDDVPILLEQHILKGEIFDRLWRGQMGFSEEEQKKSQEDRLEANGVTESGGINGQVTQEQTDIPRESTCTSQFNGLSCCLGTGNKNTTCCQNTMFGEKGYERSKGQTPEKLKGMEKRISGAKNARSGSLCKVRAIPTWYENWEREDTYAALAVVCAAASVAVACSCYKQMKR